MRSTRAGFVQAATSNGELRRVTAARRAHRIETGTRPSPRDVVMSREEAPEPTRQPMARICYGITAYRCSRFQNRIFLDQRVRIRKLPLVMNAVVYFDRSQKCQPGISLRLHARCTGIALGQLGSAEFLQI